MPENQKKKKMPNSLKGVYAVLLLLLLTVALVTKFISDNTEKLSLEDTYTPTPAPYTVTRAESLPQPSAQDIRVTQPESTETTASTQATEETQAPTRFIAATPYESYYAFPLSATMTKGYSDSAPVYSATLGDWRAHNAVDFAGAVGDRVGSIAPGEVIGVYEDVLLGTVAVIDHGNGVNAYYCGLKSEGVIQVGATVGINETVGFLGEVPSESGEDAHLHLSITVDGTAANPLEVMGKQTAEID